MASKITPIPFKNYDVLKQVGKGAYGTVYKVRSKKEKAIYALKTIDISKMDKKTLTNTLNEIRILCSIDHPNIVGYIEAFLEDDKLCVVMEYVGGGDLANRIQNYRKKKYSVKEELIWSYAIQILNGLKVLHDLKIMHRDIKSANIFLTDDYETLKLGDLNVAKIAKDDYASTQIGTPYYLAPEIWLNESYDYRCDIFSAGCVLYEMTALNIPFEAKSLQKLYEKVTKSQPHRIPQRYSANLNNIIQMFLKKNPVDRPNVYEALNLPIIKQKSYSNIFTNKKTDTASANVLLDTIEIPKNITNLNERLPRKESIEIFKDNVRRRSVIKYNEKKGTSKSDNMKLVKNNKSHSKERKNSSSRQRSNKQAEKLPLNIIAQNKIKPPIMLKCPPLHFDKAKRDENSNGKRGVLKYVPRIIPYNEYLNKKNLQCNVESSKDVFYNPFDRV